LKEPKPWFEDVCSKLLDQRKQAKFQWLQNPSHTNGDNMNNVRFETGGTFRNRKNECVKKIEL
jgi:hypothetical protein